MFARFILNMMFARFKFVVKRYCKAVTVLSSCRSCWSYDIGWYLQSADVAYAFVEVYQSLLPNIMFKIKHLQQKQVNIDRKTFAVMTST
jgi:hypothetical protein